MTENLYTALFLMVIGMISVTTILLFVVWGGRLLIEVTNKYFPIEEKSIQAETIDEPSRDIIAAIVATVDVVTKGKGKVKNVKNLNK
ncbi:MAG: hypothetical protein OEY34_01535 [Cyclobacteriaceae bacterium]|nr:hypothetical protein [Cyclobacteriaceae bacterium]